VLERQVAEQRLVERLGLLQRAAHEGRDPAEHRRDGIGQGAQVAQGAGDPGGAGVRVGRVAAQLVANVVAVGLRDPQARDLGLGTGELREDAELGDQGGGVGHGRPSVRAPDGMPTRPARHARPTV